MPYPRLKTPIPGNLIPPLKKIYCFYKRYEDHFKTNPIPGKPIPLATLRDQVESMDLYNFLDGGKKNISDIEKGLQNSGKTLSSHSPILDFGGGCGCSIIWLPPEPLSKIYGVAVHAKAISWCQQSIHIADIRVCTSFAAMEFQEDTIALFYAISVFTKLDEEYQISLAKDLIITRTWWGKNG